MNTSIFGQEVGFGGTTKSLHRDPAEKLQSGKAASGPSEGAKNIWNTGGSGWKLPGLAYNMASAYDSGTYKFLGWTYGYIQNKDYVVSANKGQIADMKINLIIGVNVTLDILFKKEHIISPTQNNMSARVRIFDDFGDLVGTWMSSEGVYTTSTTGQTLATAASDTAKYPDDGGYNYLPAGVNQLHVTIAGLPFAPEGGDSYGWPIPALPNGGESGLSTVNHYGYLGGNSPTCNTVGGCFVTSKDNGEALGTKYGDPVLRRTEAPSALATTPQTIGLRVVDYPTHTSRTKASSANQTILELVGLLK